MATETARVVALEADALWVETVRQSTCQSCTMQKGCGHGLLQRSMGQKPHYLRVLTGEYPADSFQVDDEITISVPDSALVNGALWAYIVPLLGLLFGGVIADQLALAEGLVVLAALSGFLLGLGLLRWRNNQLSGEADYQPVVVAR